MKCANGCKRGPTKTGVPSKDPLPTECIFFEAQTNGRVELSRTEQIAFLSIDEGVLTTRFNLNSSGLQDICCLLALDTTQFEAALDFLDRILLHRRNNIAHGQFIAIDMDMLHDMSDRVIEMMRKFNDLVDNQVNLQGYRA